MADQVYKITEIVGTSQESQEKAIHVALDRARESLRHVRWFEVQQWRGYVDDDGKITHQVTLKIGFAIDD